MIISDYTIQIYTTSLSTEHVTRVTLLQGFQERRGPFAQVTEHAYSSSFSLVRAAFKLRVSQKYRRSRLCSDWSVMIVRRLV